MNKRNSKTVMIFTSVICLVLAGSIIYLLAGTLRLNRETRALDEQFAQEQEKTRETIDKLKEQEAAIDTETADISEPEPSPTPESLLVSILDCLQGETLKESSLYMDNPGIYFTAQQIFDGDEIYQRAESRINPDKSGLSLSELRYLKMPYYNIKGEIQVGEMVVKASVSQEVLDGCLELFRQKQQIVSMNLEDHIWIEEDDAVSIIEKLKS